MIRKGEGLCGTAVVGQVILHSLKDTLIMILRLYF